jgi:bacillithiol biosynthesis cysteine-adding enzyme BshC
MIKKKIPYQQTGYFSKLMSDYIEGNAKLKPYSNKSLEIDSFGQLIEERKQIQLNRTVLANALTVQNASFDVSDGTKNNIEKLKNDNCFTVTTGHQLNLFTGPLYFIYKIVSAINLAKELKEKYPDNDFVPVYWMATEDHDYEEVNHFNLFGNKYVLEKTQTGAVGRMELSGVEGVFTALEEALGNRNGVDEVLSLFSKYYSSEKTFTIAIKGIVNELFGKYGLVVIDGDDKQLKGLFVDDFKNELLNRTNHEIINATSKKLIELGFKAQVTPREINIFYLIDGLRERIVFEADKYKVLNTAIEFSETELLKELESNPERFSPNAPMRCMYQERILPNLAYIGGGGELAYWLQLKAMFDANNISYPILVLRNSVLFVDKGSDKKLQKLDLSAVDLFQNTEMLIKDYLKDGSDIILELKEEEEIVETVFNDIVVKAGSIDVSLQPMIKAELQKSLKGLKNIENRLIKAEKKKEEVAVNQIKNTKEKLFPNNSLQERHDNLISLLLFYGVDVIDGLVEALNPLEQELTILTAE